MIKIRVPATSANMGPGFDSLGIALGRHSFVSVEEIESGLAIEILDDTEKFLPKDERNLVYRSMRELFDETGIYPKGVKLVLENNIPVSRGLGSSSAGIVGGLFAANEMVGRPMDNRQLLNLAARLEGHADNVTPALIGGFTVNIFQKNEVVFVRSDIKSDLSFAAFIPGFYLQTKKSRAVLPKIVTHNDAVYNTGHSAMLAASLITGNYDNIRACIGDKLHQKYRKKLIPHMDKIFDICYGNGALGCYLSGAGPTIVAIIKSDNSGFNNNINKVLQEKKLNWNLRILKPDNEGTIRIQEGY